jgi:hypothetical protein
VLDNAIDCEDVIHVSRVVVLLGRRMVDNPIAVNNELASKTKG